MPPKRLRPRIVGRLTAKICAPETVAATLLACGINCIAVCERLLQSVSLMKDMPTFSLLPTKLKPSGWKMPAMSLPTGLCSSVARNSTHHLIGALQRRAGRQVDERQHEALVFVRDEAGRHVQVEESGQDRHKREDRHPTRCVSDGAADVALVHVRGAVEGPIEPAEQQVPAFVVLRPEHRRAQRRRE